MSWRQGLRPASLAGVQFHVESREHEFGRVHHNHEYPKRDDNFAEDMHRATRRWNVEAYLVGDDYMQRRDQLIAVCERQGPHSYVDRWGRSHQVVVEPSTLRESEQEGRFCKVNLKLISAGSAPSAMGLASALAQVLGGADQATGAALVGFARNYLPGQLIDAARLANLSGVTVTPSGSARVVTGLDGLQHRLTGILD